MSEELPSPSQRLSLLDRLRGGLHWIEGLGSLPADSPDIRLKKTTQIYFSFTGIAGFVWGLMYFAVGSFFSGWIPMGYGFASLANLIYFAIRKNFAFFRFTQLFMMLMLPFLLQWSLGGFGPGSAVMIWAIASPVCALMLTNTRGARPWFIAFLALTVVSGFIDPLVAPRARDLPGFFRVLLYVMTIGATSSVMYLLLAHFTRQRDAAQELSENLLLNILPKPIADRLKEGSEPIADDYNEVTVLFADIVGFTEMSAHVDAAQVVAMLNEVFSEFDLLAEKHHLEKIKTIGDAYMVAGGLPERRVDHAEAVVEMALDMLNVLEEKRAWNGQPIRVRIGINTGPVVAGVIGRQKFIYDLWGDAVNTASRMESNGLSNVIQVTTETYKLLKGQYRFTEREPIYVKGKGEMITYLLERPVEA